MDKDWIIVIILVSVMMIVVFLNDMKRERDYLHRQIDKKNLYCYDWDRWFEHATKKICHDLYCLWCLETDSKLEKKFWMNIQNLEVKVEKDKKFQRILIDHSFTHLIYSYGLHYDFLPELEKLMNKRFENAKQAYEQGKADRKS